MRRTLPLIVAVILPIAAPATVSATPVPAAECDVRPIDPNRLVALVEAATPEPAAELPNLEGQPVERAVADAVTATIAMSVACINANDPLRALALFTDAYLARRFTADGGDDLGHFLAAITREPAQAAPEDQLSLEAVANIRLLSDGRVATAVTTANAEQRFVDTVILAFDAVSERWLIDEVILGEPEPVSTPAA
jgi:hypothetical protein